MDKIFESKFMKALQAAGEKLVQIKRSTQFKLLSWDQWVLSWWELYSN
ncbi:hypothetical protein [Anaerorhabdus sp.]